MKRLASVLAVLAVAAVLGSAVIAVSTYRGRSVEATADTESVAFADQQVVAGGASGDAVFAVPSAADGWRVKAADYSLYYGEPSGGALLVGVTGPAILDDGFCAQAEEGEVSNRGFVGLTRSAPGENADSDDVRRVNARLADDWVAAIGTDPETGKVAEHTAVETAAYPVVGGTAMRSDTVITAFAAPCSPPRIRVTILSLDTGDAIANLVMVRDVGTEQALSEETAEQILGTFRAQAA